ncbi:flagellar hook-length control protein FliK [Stakelama sp. CBK3Z-3]|uniref:Flagellar hook-length control protein FliK n=1 Tax=Stakelama flava TaxID=2860338 RepID=A0ABS6XJT1_9SPHN|nr:flagellar hook-length control protein FliK [Stakelama flava]MBW4330464.1 flagellar hook-length control protein FliK [Stakelama flava]
MMVSMQPLSLVGVSTPSAPGRTASPASGGDTGGFADLLGGTALTPPTKGAMLATGDTALPPLQLAIGETGSDAASSEPVPAKRAAGTQAEGELPASAVSAPPVPIAPALRSPDLSGKIASPEAASTGETPATDGSKLPVAQIDAPMPGKAAPSTLTGPRNSGDQADVDPDGKTVMAKASAPSANIQTETPAGIVTVAQSAEDAGDADPADDSAPSSDDQSQASTAVHVAAAQLAVPVAAPVPQPSAQAKTSKQDKPQGAATAASGIDGIVPARGEGEIAMAKADGETRLKSQNGDSAAPDSKPGKTKASSHEGASAPQRDIAAPKDFSAALDAARAQPNADPMRGMDAKSASAQSAQPPGQPSDGIVRASAPGHDMGIALARHADHKGDQVVTLRLDPGDLGRIEVRLAVDDKGMMTARVTADHHHTLDLIRRDADTLVRTLNDAGVRAETQGFRFEGGGTSGGQQNAAWNGQQGGGNGRRLPFQHDAAASDALTDPLPAQAQPLGIAAGRINLLA